jgi:hypothetical protein
MRYTALLNGKPAWRFFRYFLRLFRVGSPAHRMFLELKAKYREDAVAR